MFFNEKAYPVIEWGYEKVEPVLLKSSLIYS